MSASFKAEASHDIDAEFNLIWQIWIEVYEISFGNRNIPACSVKGAECLQSALIGIVKSFGCLFAVAILFENTFSGNFRNIRLFQVDVNSEAVLSLASSIFFESRASTTSFNFS